MKSLTEIIKALGLILLVLAVIAALFYGFIGIETYDCQKRAETMRVNWIYYPGRGCYIQQPNGSWTPIDSPIIYQQ